MKPKEHYEAPAVTVVQFKTEIGFSGSDISEVADKLNEQIMLGEMQLGWTMDGNTQDMFMGEQMGSATGYFSSGSSTTYSDGSHF